MADRRILLCLVHIGTKELEYIHRAFEDNWVVPLGPDVNAFEDDLRRYIGAGTDRELQCVALSCGTAAIHLALAACGVGAGDEVMVQSFTFCATANPVKYLGATPVFVDSEPGSWNMDPELLRSARCGSPCTASRSTPTHPPTSTASATTSSRAASASPPALG